MTDSVRDDENLRARTHARARTLLTQRVERREDVRAHHPGGDAATRGEVTRRARTRARVRVRRVDKVGGSRLHRERERGVGRALLAIYIDTYRTDALRASPSNGHASRCAGAPEIVARRVDPGRLLCMYQSKIGLGLLRVPVLISF